MGSRCLHIDAGVYQCARKDVLFLCLCSPHLRVNRPLT